MIVGINVSDCDFPGACSAALAMFQGQAHTSSWSCVWLRLLWGTGRRQSGSARKGCCHWHCQTPVCRGYRDRQLRCVPESISLSGASFHVENFFLFVVMDHTTCQHGALTAASASAPCSRSCCCPAYCPAALSSSPASVTHFPLTH